MFIPLCTTDQSTSLMSCPGSQQMTSFWEKNRLSAVWARAWTQTTRYWGERTTPWGQHSSTAMICFASYCNCRTCIVIVLLSSYSVGLMSAVQFYQVFLLTNICTRQHLFYQLLNAFHMWRPPGCNEVVVTSKLFSSSHRNLLEL